MTPPNTAPTATVHLDPLELERAIDDAHIRKAQQYQRDHMPLSWTEAWATVAQTRIQRAEILTDALAHVNIRPTAGVDRALVQEAQDWLVNVEDTPSALIRACGKAQETLKRALTSATTSTVANAVTPAERDRLLRAGIGAGLGGGRGPRYEEAISARMGEARQLAEIKPAADARCPDCTRADCPHHRRWALSDGGALREEQECQNIKLRLAAAAVPAPAQGVTTSAREALEAALNAQIFTSEQGAVLSVIISKIEKQAEVLLATSDRTKRLDERTRGLVRVG